MRGKLDDDLVQRMRAFLAEAETIVADTMRTRAKNTGLKEATLDPFYVETTEAVRELSSRLIDDFSYGMLGSDKLKKDSVVSVINGQTNSPGAVQ